MASCLPGIDRWLFPWMLNQRKQTGGRNWTTYGPLPATPLPPPVLTPTFILMLICCYCGIFHKQLLTWQWRDRHRRTYSGLNTIKSGAEQTVPLSLTNALLNVTELIASFHCLHHQSSSSWKHPHRHWVMSSRSGTPFLISSHVHPKYMQLSSPLSATHYHNCICGCSHCNNLAQVPEWLTCCRFRLRRLLQRMELLEQYSVSQCLLEVIITA